ncbi:[acyl-carrier-protein] S-malonyltransferase [Breznakia blatticola]|uniref:Malonyl CoA-acyl carrier protein transacylase n=1 Tax=Breznakia blatticola TaxID=1754012 RepID=A0A4R7ZCX8_9FIRM|nr:ACP S-malonyltransferase [Breznakia blatticola]TDW14726.1 [acyl-carrier-protein] S-malonyltransferase [Breznakia blatticola]
MKIGFLFAGQGAQKVGMGKELYDQYALAASVYDGMQLDYDVKKLCFEGPADMLNDTAYAQSAILTTSLAIASVISSYGITPDYVAGLSLGEYSALAYAGAMSYQDAATITRKRGQLMANALPAGTTGMAAVLNLDATLIQEVCDEINEQGELCQIANYNCPGQIVITGTTKAMELASEALVEKGARRVIPLQVSGAFHSSLLKEAGSKLRSVLQQAELRSPNLPVVYNISGKEEQADLVDILEKQIQSSVYFTQSIEYMIAQGVTTFIEIGPGSTLKGFVRKISRDVNVYSVEDQASLEAMIKEVKANE